MPRQLDASRRMRRGAARAVLSAAFLMPGTASAAPPACQRPEYRAFDFWVGSWEVLEHGRVVGTNTIERVLGGCALTETWRGAGGHEGRSLSFYDDARARWHQTWIDARGQPLVLEGTAAADGIQLQGVRPAATGTILHRVSWSRRSGGHVRQHWQTSPDGEHWTTVFDGTYVRVAGPNR